MMQEDFLEVVVFCCFWVLGGFNVYFDNWMFNEFNVVYVDSIFFQFFGVNFLDGNLVEVFCVFNIVVIFQVIVQKYFGL